MKTTKNSKKLLARIFAVIIPVIFVFTAIFANEFQALGKYMPKCKFYMLTGFACPACGNTRSVTALLNGNILISLKYNITPIILIIAILWFWAQCVIWAFNGNKKLWFKNNKPLYVFLAVMCSYYIARNFIPFLAI